jgi:hypothetical protein
VLELAAFSGKVTAPIVVSSADDRAQITRNSSFDFALVLGIADSGVKIAPLVVGSSTQDRPQLTCRNGVPSQIYL